jgi:hypothetical protein
MNLFLRLAGSSLALFLSAVLAQAQTALPATAIYNFDSPLKFYRERPGVIESAPGSEQLLSSPTGLLNKKAVLTRRG